MVVLRSFAAVAAVAIVAALAVPPAGAHAGGASAEKTPPPKPRPFGRGTARHHERPQPAYRITDQRIGLSFDLPASTIRGRTEIDVVDTTGAPSLAFDSVGLTYATVTIDGAPAHFRSDDAHLNVDVPDPADRAKTHTIVAEYSAAPQRGIYFIAPDTAYPDRRPEIWTQGEEEDNRRWFPTWDEPNMKFPTTLSVRVPADWDVVANGARVEGNGILPAPGAGERVVTWREAKPHSSYLTSFVAGPYVRVHDTLGTLPVDYYVHPGRETEAKTCFGRTPQMIAFFQQFTGTPYAWEKYAQTTVQWFTAGGMENVSATTQTNLALHPAAYDLESPCDGLVSHELAHQWFGDLVTTPDWANIWINEGFATYFQELWTEHRWGTNQFDYERYHAQQTYFRETQRYWRPIVDADYGSAHDVFDSSGYPRPAQGLHMLRVLLGDDGFRHAIASYLAADSFTNVDTREFQHQVEKASGRDLGWFFDEWYFTPSHPHYVVRERWDAARTAEVLDVTQRNHGGYLFRMPITVAVEANGVWTRKTFDVRAAHATLVVPDVAAAPTMVLFDEANRVIRTLDDRKSVAMLAEQARHAPNVPDRLWALARLGEATPADRAAARRAVRAVATGDHFYGVRADAADAAAALDDAATLVAMLSDLDPRVAIAAARATGSLDHPGDATLVASLRRLATSSDLMVRAAALAGLGATKSAQAKSVLLAALNDPSPNDVVATGALEGLGQLGDPSTFGAVAARAAYGRPDRVRPAAISAMARFARVRAMRSRVEAALRPYLHDRYFRVRAATVQALGRTRDPAVIPWLADVQAHDAEPSVTNNAYDAIADLRDRRRAPAPPGNKRA